MYNCHFKDGNKANPPTVLKRNAEKCFELSGPKKRHRKQPLACDRLDLEDLSPNYCYVNLMRNDQHFEDSHMVDKNSKSRHRKQPLASVRLDLEDLSSVNTLFCKKEESATEYVEPSKLQAVTKIKSEILDDSASYSCSNANLNDADEIKSEIKIEPLVSNYEEKPFDIKLLLKPVVVLEKMNPSKSDCIHSGKSVHVNKVLAKREGIVEKLKKDLLTLKQSLKVDTVQSEKYDDIIGSAALERKRMQNRKVDAILPRKNNDNIGLADLKRKKSQTWKPGVNSTTTSDWIKVEDVSDLSNKKIYYIYSGEKCEDLSDSAKTVDDKTSNVADCNGVGCLMVTEDKEKRSRFRCSLCRKAFVKLSALKCHITYAHKLSKKCFKCGLCFGSKEELKVHMSMPHDEAKSYIKPNMCPICYKRCNSKRCLEDHLALHECPAYGCAGCKSSFVEFGFLKLHLPCPNVAERMPAYLCLLCQETFFIGNELRRHVQSTHCKKATIIPNAYRKHYIFSQVQNTDGDNEGRFECNKCGRKFRSRESAKNHLPCFFKTCSICGKTFEKETKLKAHMRLFHNDQAVECLICNRRFEKQCKLDAHQSRFQGHCVNKVHMCSYCGLTFRCPESLMVHVTNHEKISEHKNASLNNSV